MKLHAKKILNYIKNLWNEILQLFCVYFMKLDIFENFIGKILLPSNESLSQIEYNEIKLYCHNIAIMLQLCVEVVLAPVFAKFYFSRLY